MKIEEAISHCYDVANQNESCDGCKYDHLQLARWLEELVNLRKVLSNPAELEKRNITIETNLYDKVSMYDNCTVQILENSVTGEMSIGWWQNKE